MQLLRAQLLARTSALATLRNAYYVEVVRTKRMLLESGMGIGYAQVAPVYSRRSRLHPNLQP